MTMDTSFVNLHEAQTNLSAIIENVKKLGKPMIIAQGGEPQVKIVPITPPSQSRFGFMKGELTHVPEDFDEMYQEEIEALFAGSDK